MIPEEDYTPTMRQLIDIINAGQGQTGTIIVGIENDGFGRFKIVVADDPNNRNELED
jgi:hypothetical protein